jgi:hypothetical protein
MNDDDDRIVDFPWDEVVMEAERLTRAGFQVYQKFTCSGCGQRLTIETPNRFYETGSCDKCDVITDIKKQGCNFLLVGAAP